MYRIFYDFSNFIIRMKYFNFHLFIIHLDSTYN